MTLTNKENSDVIERLTEVFRTVGYDGATLSKLSEATGLQRASLYHRFPGGKREMAEAVLVRADNWVQDNILGPLSGPGSPRERLESMCGQLDTFYCRGNSSCLLDALSFGEGGEIFQSAIDGAFRHWIQSLAGLVVEATGIARKDARIRAEDAVIQIQGALVLSRGTGNTKAFGRTLRSLPHALLKSS